MRIPIAALLFASALAGCHRDGLPVGGDQPARDMARADLGAPPSLDMTPTVADMAKLCVLDAPNSAVTAGNQTLGYAWLGNLDSGAGESTCAGPAELVQVLFSVDGANGPPEYRAGAARVNFSLDLPLALGTHATEVRSVVGQTTGAPATVEVTSFTPDDGRGLGRLEGTIDAPSIQLSGSFTAVHCWLLDVICI
jgi:hypothetical protein